MVKWSLILFTLVMVNLTLVLAEQGYNRIPQTITSTTVNNNTINVNNSQFLRGLTPAQVAALYTDIDTLQSVTTRGSSTITAISVLNDISGNRFLTDTGMFDSGGTVRGLYYDVGASNKWRCATPITFNQDVEVLNGIHGPSIGSPTLSDNLYGATTTSTTFTDGVMSITGGSGTGFVSLTSTALSDGTCSINSGALTNCNLKGNSGAMDYTSIAMRNDTNNFTGQQNIYGNSGDSILRFGYRLPTTYGSTRIITHYDSTTNSSNYMSFNVNHAEGNDAEVLKLKGNGESVFNGNVTITNNLSMTGAIDFGAKEHLNWINNTPLQPYGLFDFRELPTQPTGAGTQDYDYPAVVTIHTISEANAYSVKIYNDAYSKTIPTFGYFGFDSGRFLQTTFGNPMVLSTGGFSNQNGIIIGKLGEVSLVNLSSAGIGLGTKALMFANKTGGVFKSQITLDSATRSLNVPDNIQVTNITITGNLSAKLPIWVGYDNSVQPLISATAAQPINVSNNGDIDAYQITVVGRQNLTFIQSGKYSCTLSPEFFEPQGQTGVVTFWLQKNGVDVPWSNSRYTLPSNFYSAPSISFNFNITTPATDNVRFMWWSDNANTQLYSSGALTNPTRPSIPAVLLDCKWESSLT